MDLKPKSISRLLVTLQLSFHLNTMSVESKQLNLADFSFCQRDILVIYSSNSTSTWFLKQDSSIDVSLLDFKSFLEAPVVHFQHRIPQCLIILQDFYESAVDTTPQEDVHLKAKDLVASLGALQRKPVVLFINYLFTPGESFTVQQQRDYLFNAQLNQPTPLDLDFYYIFASMENEILSIWETYSIKGNPRVNEFFISSGNNEQFNEPIESTWTNKAVRRQNFTDIPIVGIIRKNQADWMDFRFEGKKIVLTNGFSVNIYWDLKLILNFNEMAVIGDGVVTLPNKTLGGKTVSLLNSGDADLSLSQSSLVPFRAKQLTFLQPTYSGIIYIFFKQPAANSIRNIVTAPFRNSLWMVLVCTWVFFIFVVKIGSALQQHIFCCNGTKSLSQKQPEEDRKFASQVAMWTFAANCQKSWHTPPCSPSMRLMFLMGMFCGVVTYVAYSGAIVSTLAVSITPVKQFMQLMHYKFTFTVHEWSEPFQVFLKLLIDQYSLPQQVHKISTEIEITHLLDHTKPRAFFTYPDAFYTAAIQLNYTAQFICKNIDTIIFSNVPITSGLFLKKGSVFTEIFNHKLLMIKERGLNHRYVKTYDTKSSISCIGADNVQNFDPVTFSDVFTAFLVICFGVGISLVLSFIEYLLHKTKDQYLNQEEPIQ